MTRRIPAFVLFWCFAGIAGLGFAQGNYARIARLSYLDGNVSFQHTNDADWSATSINMPLQEGDRIYTGPQGRAEIQFDEGSVFRLAENTDVEILSLEDNLIQVRILLGLSTLTVSSGLDFEIDTPTAAFNTLSKGIYRFDVIESGNTDGIVRNGSMEAANDQFSRRLRSGELIHITPGGMGVQTVSRYQISAGLRLHRRIGPGSLRALGDCRGLWCRLDALFSKCRVDALLNRPMGLSSILGLDLGIL
jgi:hypothetical protein